jgi:hypothetical protein
MTNVTIWGATGTIVTGVWTGLWTGSRLLLPTMMGRARCGLGILRPFEGAGICCGNRCCTSCCPGLCTFTGMAGLTLLMAGLTGDLGFWGWFILSLNSWFVPEPVPVLTLMLRLMSMVLCYSSSVRRVVVVGEDRRICRFCALWAFNKFGMWVGFCCGTTNCWAGRWASWLTVLAEYLWASRGLFNGSVRFKEGLKWFGESFINIFY